ncbi:MAG TPA: hypothetical protein VH540_27010 [Ktedonobacterales bacterium]
MQSSSGAPAQPASSSGSSWRIPRRWLPLARAAWGVCALLLLANFVASIPAYYQLMSTVCPLTNQVGCTDDSAQLSASTIQGLTRLHLSLTDYAIYFVTLNVLVSLLPWGIGLLLFWRKSAEGMGLLVSLLLILFGGDGAGNTLSLLWVPSPTPPLFSTLSEVISGAQWIGLGAFLLTFPTGQFAPRWSMFVLSFWIITFLSPTIPGPDFVQGAVSVLSGVLVFGGTLSVLIYRYLRVFHATQRQQTKWVVYAAAAWVIFSLLGDALPGVLSATSPFQALFPTVTLLLSSVLLYLGLGFAMLRYRLWDIDTIINRTLVYGTLTAILTLTYVGVIIGLSSLTQAVTGQAGDQPLVIVGSTLLIIALFSPLRGRIQTFIDRRFYRRKYDAVKILESFSTSLRTEVGLGELREQLIAVVQETMQPAHVSLWLRPPSPRQGTRGGQEHAPLAYSKR